MGQTSKVGYDGKSKVKCTIEDTMNYFCQICMYENGKMESIYQSIDSVAIYMVWYNTGEIWLKEQYRNRLPYGTFTSWYKNGNKMYEGSYIYSIKKNISFSIKTKVDSIYENNFIDYGGYSPIAYINIDYKMPRMGKWKYWYENGILKQESSYLTSLDESNNYKEIRNGDWLFYDEKGNFLKKVVYKNDLLINSSYREK